MWIYAFWAFITVLVVVGAFYRCDCPECTNYRTGDME
jgi:hypothetical protein